MSTTELDLSTNDGFWSVPFAERSRVYRTLRDETPISFHPEPATERFEEGPGFWALARHADVLAASRSPELFCSGQGAVIRDLPPAYNEFFGSMLAMDDPRHARLRSLVSAGFTPRMMVKIEADIRRAAVDIVAAAGGDGTGNFVDDIAARLPLRIICDMMGIPAESYDFVLQQTNIILDPGSNPVGVPRGQAVYEAGMALAGLMEDLIERPGLRNGDNVTAALLEAEVDGQRLTTQEIQSFFVLLCAAGNETTRNAIAWGLWLLTNHPEQRRRLIDDFDSVAMTAADEIVRYASPVNQFRRTVTTDGVSLGEGEHRHVFAQGDKVVLLYGSANRDPLAFTDPDRFDVTRDPNPHVGFGGPGPHFCLGAHLARREMVVLFDELFTVYPDIVSTSEPDRIVSNQIHGIRYLGYQLG